MNSRTARIVKRTLLEFADIYVRVSDHHDDVDSSAYEFINSIFEDPEERGKYSNFYEDAKSNRAV